MPTFNTPYQILKLQDFIAQVLDLVDDVGGKYWVQQEVQFATYEALYYWGALTNYWRNRATFRTDQYQSAFNQDNTFQNVWDLSNISQTRTYRPQTITLDQMVREIQYMLLENPGGLAGQSMSGQVTIETILQSINYAVSRFILDTRLPTFTQTLEFQLDINSGEYTTIQEMIYLHRACFQTEDNQYFPLWRQDQWGVDRALPYWTTTPGQPFAYTQSQLAPLQVQLIPAPGIQTLGLLVTGCFSLATNDFDINKVFRIPNEWVHAVKYAALSQILSNPSQIADPVRAQYAESRYKQSVAFAKDARSITGVRVNNLPLPICSVTDLDAADPNWMNVYGSPYAAGVSYDTLWIAPGKLDQQYGLGLDLVSAAPLPDLDDYMPVGAEEIDNLKDYIVHILSFKCGGKDFTSTMGGYDSFVKCAGARGAINAAQIQYFTPIFGQAQIEWAQRPDKVESNA